MNESTITIKKATIGIALLVLASKAIGFIREAVIAYKFGTGIDYDVYLIAVSIPLTLYELSYASFSNLMIPAYARAVNAPERARGMSTLWIQFNASLLGAATAMVIVILAAPQLIHLVAPGMALEHLPEAIFIARASSILIVVAVAGSFCHAILNAEKRFFLPAAAPIVANVVIISAILMLAGQISTQAIMYGLVAGLIAQTIVMLVPFSRIGMLRYYKARFIEPHIGKFFISAAAILIIEAAARFFAIVDRYFASYMEAGVISALGYAYLLMMLPIALFAYALSTAVFPFLSDAFAARNRERESHLLTRGVSVSLLLSLPTLVVYFFFADQLVTLLFRRGAFDVRSVAYTAGLLKYFALVFPGQFILWMMSRAYYAARRFDLLLVQVTVMIATKIGLTAIGVNLYQSAGLPLASAVSYSLGALILLLLANHFLARLDAARIAIYFAKVLVATTASGVAACYLSRWLQPAVESGPEFYISVLLAVTATLAVFLGAAYLLRVADVVEMVRFRKLRA